MLYLAILALTLMKVKKVS